MENKYFKQDAKQLVDQLFDTEILRDDITRDDMSAVEDLIEYLLQSKFDTYQRIEKLTERMDKVKK